MRLETLARAAALREKFSEIPFLRSLNSSIIQSYYCKNLQHISVLPVVPVNVVKPKAVRAGTDKENEFPINSKNFDNPEDYSKRVNEFEKSKSLKEPLTSRNNLIVSTELMSCMEYPARFASFIKGRCKLQESQMHMLRPLENSTTSNKLSQSTQFIRD